MNSKLLALAAFSLIGTAACGPSSDENTDPNQLPGQSCAVLPCFTGGDVAGEKNFAVLINNYSKAKLTPTPWAGYWWAYSGNGIAKNTGGGSPAGKYDAARGKRLAQAWEARNHGAHPGVKGWEGHCNGWCAAAALFPEPKHGAKVNGINFSIADIKALLSEAGMEASVDFFGNRVDYAVSDTSPKYLDVIPNQFFLIATNYMGKHNIPVNIDRYTLDQVWNQPMVGYEMKYPVPADYLGEDPRVPGVYRINLTATMWWSEDGVPEDVQTPQFNFSREDYGTTPGGWRGVIFTPREMRMEIWLDGPVVFGSEGKITSSGNVVVTRQPGTDYFIGGAWKMGGFSSENWPDYMWIPYSFQPGTQNYQNPYIDYVWLKEHLINPEHPQGLDDPSASPIPIDPVPSIGPTDVPTHTPTPTTTPTPTPQPSLNAPGNAPAPMPQPQR